MKSLPFATLFVTILFGCGLSFLQAKDKRIRDDDPLMERYRNAEREIKHAMSEGRISREEAGRKLRVIKGRLWGDEREKGSSRDKGDPRHELRQAERRIQEAIEKGEISHEEARKKLTEFHEGQKKASREREWKMIKERIEGAVREGKMSREQANEEYKRIERSMHSRDKIAREANERVRKAEREIHEGLEAGEISHEEARQAVGELHEEMNYVVRRKHLELELQDHERRIEQALESGVISKSQAEEKRIKVRQRLTKQFRIELGHEESNARRGSDEREGRERHHEARHHSREREGREDRRHHEDERELWEAVRRGLDAAVRLGKLDRQEAREIWEDFRSEDEEEEDEEAFEEEDLE